MNRMSWLSVFLNKFAIRWIVMNSLGVGCALFFFNFIHSYPILLIVFFVLASILQLLIQWVSGATLSRSIILLMMSVPMALLLLLILFIYYVDDLDFFLQYIFLEVGALIGLSLGFAQWVVLYKELKKPEWWMVFTAIGWVVGFGSGEIGYEVLHFLLSKFSLMPYELYNPNGEIVLWIVSGLISGTVIGIFQWSILLDNSVYRSQRWIAVNALAWPFAWVLGYFIPGAVFTWYGGIVVGMIYALLTLIPLAGLLSQTPDWSLAE